MIFCHLGAGGRVDELGAGAPSLFPRVIGLCGAVVLHDLSQAAREGRATANP